MEGETALSRLRDTLDIMDDETEEDLWWREMKSKVYIINRTLKSRTIPSPVTGHGRCKIELFWTDKETGEFRSELGRV